MVDKNNLNRIKGILSAKKGAEIPKFQNPGGSLPKLQGINQFYQENGKFYVNGQEVSENEYNNLKLQAQQNIDNFGKDQLGEDFNKLNELSNQVKFRLNPISENTPIVSNNSTISVTDPDFQKWCANLGLRPSPDNLSKFQEIKTNNPNANFQQLITLGNATEESPMKIPGAEETGPYAAVEHAADLNKSIEAKIKERKANAVASTPLQAPPIQGVTVPEPVSLNTDISQLQQKVQTKMKQEAESYGMNLQKQAAKKEKWTNRGMQAGQAITGAVDIAGKALNAKQMTENSTTTNLANGLYDGATEIANQFGPVGKIVGTAMKFADTAGMAIRELGRATGERVDTDQMTTTDKWMDSSFFSWNIGLINGGFGKNTQNFAIDQSTAETVGSSYGGTMSAFNEAADTAGKRYGLFSQKARRKADENIAKAKGMQSDLSKISETALNQRMYVQSTGEQAGLAYSMMADGGYNQKYTYAAKEGGILEWNPVIELEWEPQIDLNWELSKFKEGGNVDIIEELEWIPEFKSESSSKLSKEVLDFYKDYDLSDVNVIMSEYPRTEGNKLYIRNDEDAIHELWHYLSQNRPNEIYKEYYDSLNDNRIVELGGDLQFVKRMKNDPGHFYHPSELEARIKAAKFKTKGQNYTKEFFQNLRKEENKYGDNMRDLLHMYNDDNLVKIFSLKKGGSVGNSNIPEIEETNQKNVIPEGALHKNKHHMEHAEGLTKKGIPVIDDNGEQQAEIEHSEIIFTLEVTKKLEEYYEIFYSEESTNKEKEQAALEAGQLLVYQILENTEDRTGLIDSCKKGGTLNLKKSTEDLIEEALEWMPTITIIEEVIEEEKPKKKSEKSELEKDDLKEQVKDVIREALIELLIK